MKGINYILLLFILTSCSYTNDGSISSFLKEWEQKEILFPKEMYFTKMLKDTTCYNLNSEYKILVYIDSVGCTSCKLQLSAWETLIKEVDSLCIDKVNFIFVFSSHRIKDIHYAILTANFNYPVCVDDRDSIAKLNSFPSDSKLHTFLLDKDNKVIAVGNPIYNPKIKDLYMKIILGTNYTFPYDKRLETSAGFNGQSLDMGDFDWEQKQVAEFTLYNIGKELLVINDVNTSCGCTTIEYSQEPIQPEGKATLRVMYKAEQPEYFNKTITVYCTAKGSPFELTISGNAQ